MKRLPRLFYVLPLVSALICVLLGAVLEICTDMDAQWRRVLFALVVGVAWPFLLYVLRYAIYGDEEDNE